MPPSNYRHPLALLRKIIGLNQQQFATLTHRSGPTVRAVELCNLALSNKFAEDIASATGIDPKWLLAGDTSAEPKHIDGGHYTREKFEDWRAVHMMESASGKLPLNSEDRNVCLARHVEAFAKRIEDVLRAAMEKDLSRYAVANYRIDELVRKTETEFGQSISE